MTINVILMIYYMMMKRSDSAVRIDRIDRLIGLLKEDREWTTHALSLELEVSSRTIMRDLKILQSRDYPIDTDRGRGGGVRLDRRWGVEKLQLSNEEMVNILVSLAITESLESPLMQSQVRSVRQKISRTFPVKQQAAINRLRSRILVGKPASEIVLSTYSPPNSSIVETVTSAFFNQNKIEIKYLADTGNKTDRLVDAQCLLLNWPVWYLMGWDQLRDAPRVFRIDRIKAATNTGEAFKPRRKSSLMHGHETFFQSV